MSQEELISRILDLHIPIVIMPVDCEESTPEPIEEFMLQHPSSNANERYIIAYNNNINSSNKTDELNKIPGFHA